VVFLEKSLVIQLICFWRKWNPRDYHKILKTEGINLEMDFFFFNNLYKFSKLREIARVDTVYN